MTCICTLAVFVDHDNIPAWVCVRNSKARCSLPSIMSKMLIQWCTCLSTRAYQDWWNNQLQKNEWCLTVWVKELVFHTRVPLTKYRTLLFLRRHHLPFDFNLSFLYIFAVKMVLTSNSCDAQHSNASFWILFDINCLSSWWMAILM